MIISANSQQSNQQKSKSKTQRKKKQRIKSQLKIHEITKHLQLELSKIHSFFNFRKPKEFQSNDIYLAFIEYFNQFGVDLDSKNIWNHKKIRDYNAVIKQKDILRYAKNQDQNLFSKIQSDISIKLINKYANSPKNVKNTSLFSFTQNKYHNKQILNYPFNIIWNNEDYIHDQSKNIEHRKKCRFCLGHFDNSIKNVFFRCDWCASYRNRCHLHEIVVVGNIKNFILCPQCVLSKEWNLNKSPQAFSNVEEIVYTFKHDQKLYNVFRVHNGHLLSEYVIIGFYNEVISDRFIVLDSVQSALNKHFKIIELKTKYTIKCINSKYTVQWKVYSIKIAKHQLLYNKQCNPNATCCSKWKLPEYNEIHISNIGPLQYDGFFVLPGIGQHIQGFSLIDKKITAILSKIYPQDIDPIYNEIISENCSSVYFKRNKNRYLINILSFGWSYKGGITCYDLSHNDEIDADFENHPGNHLEYYQPLKKYSPKQNNRLKVVESDIHKVIEKKYPQLIEALKDLKTISSQLLFAVSKEIKQLHNICTQYLKRGFKNGSEYENVDCIVYYRGHVVSSHVDHKDLVNLSSDSNYSFIKNHGPLLPGPYLVWKLNINSKPQILCNNSKPGNQCINSTDDKNGFGKFNHIKLIGGTMYAMISHGVFGGPTHSIHNNIQPFGGFEDESVTIVMRPKT